MIKRKEKTQNRADTAELPAGDLQNVEPKWPLTVSGRLRELRPQGVQLLIS